MIILFLIQNINKYMQSWFVAPIFGDAILPYTRIEVTLRKIITLLAL